MFIASTTEILSAGKITVDSSIRILPGGTVSLSLSDITLSLLRLLIYYITTPLQVGSAKGMEKVALWTDNIVRHFWHCSSLASEVEGTDAEALKKMKVTFPSTTKLTAEFERCPLQYLMLQIYCFTDITNQEGVKKMRESAVLGSLCFIKLSPFSQLLF